MTVNTCQTSCRADAKTKDEAQNASEAATKRHLTDKRLQDKLRKGTDSVRRAEEAKKDKHSANRKEEEIQLKNTVIARLQARIATLEGTSSSILSVTAPPTLSIFTSRNRCLLRHHTSRFHHLSSPVSFLPSQDDAFTLTAICQNHMIRLIGDTVESVDD